MAEVEGLLVSGRARELREVLLDKLPANVSVKFHESSAEVAEADFGAEFLVGAPDELARLLPKLPAVKWVQSTWAGVRPLVDLNRRDYQLTGLKNVFGRSMAEYVLGWSLALHRSILTHATAEHWEWKPEPGLAPLRLGIAGTGSIGQEVAAYCAPFFRDIVGLNSKGTACPFVSVCYPTSERLSFARGVDVLVLILPDTPATDRLVDLELLRTLNPGAIVINGGRANALVLEDLVKTLRTGQLAAAVVDVFTQEPLPRESALWDENNLYITSHTAAPTAMTAIADVFLKNLSLYVAGKPLEGCIDVSRGY